MLPLSGFLGKKYITEKFNTDIDELFKKHDINNQGMMDLEHVKAFLEDLQQHMSPDLAANCKNADIDALFEKYDENKNGKLEKPEISIFIKKVLAKKQ